jgi:hypothetical protein
MPGYASLSSARLPVEVGAKDIFYGPDQHYADTPDLLAVERLHRATLLFSTQCR